MNKSDLRVLLVDDHELILKGILDTFHAIGIRTVHTEKNCDKAFLSYKIARDKGDPFDLVFTDLSFDRSEEWDIKSGETLMRSIRNLGNPPPIGVITGHAETNRLYNVIKNQIPDAYILKHDCSQAELELAVIKMLRGEHYYSHEVHQKIMNRKLIDIRMDDSSLEILRQFSKQYKISNMVGVIKNKKGKELSLRSIDNRLAELRADLNAVNNIDLVVKAKELGVID